MIELEFVDLRSEELDKQRKYAFFLTPLYWQALSILSSGSLIGQKGTWHLPKNKKKALLPNFILHQYSSPYVLV